MRSVGARTRPSASSPARSGLPPRETTARTRAGSSAASCSAAAAPVLAPKRPAARPPLAGSEASQRSAACNRSISTPMSKRSACSRSSPGVSRSTSSVPRPAERNSPATNRLRGLSRLEPLPWAKSTTPRASGGTSWIASSSTPRPAGIATSMAPSCPQHERILHLVARLDPHALRLEVLLDRLHPVRAPEAARLVAAEGGIERECAIGVDPHGAGLEPLRERVRAADVARPESRGEPEARRVRHAHDLVVVAEPREAEHRAEDLL